MEKQLTTMFFFILYPNDYPRFTKPYDKEALALCQETGEHFPVTIYHSNGRISISLPCFPDTPSASFFIKFYHIVAKHFDVTEMTCGDMWKVV